MIVVASLVMIAFLILNINAFLILNKKKDAFLSEEQRKNTNYVYLRWLILILFNAGMICLLPLSNMYFDVHGGQAFIDSLATIGFVITILLSLMIYIYILRFRKFMNVSYSLGIILIYSIEYVLTTMMVIYYIFS